MAQSAVVDSTGPDTLQPDGAKSCRREKHIDEAVMKIELVPGITLDINTEINGQIEGFDD